MPRQAVRPYARITRHAVALLGKQIRIARKQRGMTAQDLADRTGISRGLLQRIEQGSLNCQIGIVFEAATLVGIKLFEADEASLTASIARADDKIALLPKRAHRSRNIVEDDF